MRILRRVRIAPGAIATLPGAAWWVMFFAIPFVFFVSYAFLTPGFFTVTAPWSTNSFQDILRDPLTLTYLGNSAAVGLPAAAVCVALAVAVSYWLRYNAGRWATPAMLSIVGTIFASYLVRIYAWRSILGEHGLVNDALMSLGVSSEPVSFLLYNRFSTAVALVHMLFPVALLLVYNAFRPIDAGYLEAARDLGAGRFRIWTRFLVPSLAAPVSATFLLMFVIASADWATPRYLGSGRNVMAGERIQQLFVSQGDIPAGASLSLIVLVLFAVTFLLLRAALRLFGVDRLHWRDAAPTSPWRNRPGGALFLLVLVFLYLPLTLVILFSFNSTARLSFPIDGLSFRWYQAFFEDRVAVDALLLSLKVGVLVTAITIVLGFLTALGLVRLAPRFERVATTAFLLPVVVPPLFLGLSLLVLLIAWGVPFSAATVVAAHLLLTVPLFVMLALSALRRVDPALFEVATDLGASTSETFRLVVWPLLWPSFAAACAICFVVSFDEFVVTVFNSGNQSTLPMYINGILRKSVNPTINSVSTMMLVGTFVLLAIGTGFFVLSERRRRQA